MVLARLPFSVLTGDRAPYALNFLALVIAAVLAGWRSGLLALVVGQLLTWYLIVPPYFSFEVIDSQRFGGLVMATVSQALVLLVIALYQREVDKGTTERERRMELLAHALHEIDHRTSNNYQTVLALIHLQTQHATNSEIKKALRQVSDRIGAIAKASEQLAFRSDNLAKVRIDEHLCELCGHIEQGLSRDGVEIQCEVTACSAPADSAIALSMIVNELVTNALKHAFPEGRPGLVLIEGTVNGHGLELTVSDNGRGMKPVKSRARVGLGTRLIENYVRQLGATYEVDSSDDGTSHKITVPDVA